MTDRYRYAVPLAALFLGTPALAAPQLAAHLAVYEIDLADASERSGIKGMSGRMVYDFGGSSCDGYTMSFRFVTRIETEDASRLTDQQTRTFENVEDGVFQFSTRSFVDETQDRDVKGLAQGRDGRTEVELTSPDERSLELPSTTFPTLHMIELLQAAKDGERFFEQNLFDGSDDADKVMATTAVIGSMVRHESDGQEGDGEVLPREFNGLRYWPVTIAYYPLNEGQGEALPLYRIEMKLYENGVTRDIAMDYGEFQLEGSLQSIEMREPDRCE